MRKFDLFTKTLAMVGFLQACTLIGPGTSRGKRTKCSGGCGAHGRCRGYPECHCLFFVCIGR